jgi:hypothetical protein
MKKKKRNKKKKGLKNDKPSKCFHLKNRQDPRITDTIIKSSTTTNTPNFFPPLSPHEIKGSGRAI